MKFGVGLKLVVEAVAQVVKLVTVVGIPEGRSKNCGAGSKICDGGCNFQVTKQNL